MILASFHQICRKATVRNIGSLSASVTLAMRNISVRADPEIAGMDEPVLLSVSGLTPGEQLTVAARLTEEKMNFVSYAHYTADAQGTVDVSVAHSSGGNYIGCEPMGLLWSLSPEEGTRPGSRVRKKDVREPHKVDIGVLSGHVCVKKAQQLTGHVHTTIHRHYMFNDVIRIPVRHGNIRGTMFIPKNGCGRHAGVLDLYGSTGGLAEYRAALLASRGFTTFALAYMGYEDLPTQLTVQYEYFLEAIDYLNSHENVLPGGIGIVGISFGAELALGLSSVCDKIRGVAAIGSPDFTSMVYSTYQGEEIPYTWLDPDLFERNEHGVSLRKAHMNSECQEEAMLKVEKSTDCHYLILHGADDQNIDARFALRLATRLSEHKRDFYSCHVYPGTGHLIEPPYMPFCYASWHPPLGISSIWGGQADLHSAAQVDAWQKILRFFKNKLPGIEAAKL